MLRLINLLKNSFNFRLLLSALSGLIAVFAWPPSTWNFMLLFAFVPVIMAFYYSPNIKNALLNIFVCLFLFHSISMSWFSSITDQPLANALIYFAYLLIPFGQTLPWLLSYWVMRKKGIGIAFFALPFFCLSYEIFHYHWDLSYTWMHLGLGFSESPYFLKLYPYMGQEGGSFFIYLSNLLLATIFLTQSGKKRIMASGILILLLVLPLLIPKGQSQKSTDSIKIGVYQPSTDPKQIYTNETIDSNFNLLKTAVEERLDEKIDLLACPEGYFRNFHDNPIIFNNPFKHNIVQKLMQLSQEHDFGIITGVIVIQLYYVNDPPTVSALKKKDGLYYDTYNAAMLIEPNGNIQWRPKSRLVAFTERVPFLEIFKFLEVLHLDFTQSAGSYNYKKNSLPFTYKNMVIAPLICYESLYPGVTNGLLQRKSNIVMEFSNENWSGTTNKGQQQHESYASVNAAQFGKNYVRSTFNKGSSVFFENGIDKYQRDTVEDDFIVLEADLIEGKTFYTNYRNNWNYVFFITIVLIFISLIDWKASKRKLVLLK